MTARGQAPVHGTGLGWHEFPGGCADLSLWLPSWVRCAVRCTAHRTNGTPCRAWAVHGAVVCVVHGGKAPQVRQAAQRRLAIATWERAYVRLLRRVLADQERRRRELA